MDAIRAALHAAANQVLAVVAPDLARLVRANVVFETRPTPPAPTA
jgi:hypothetical protein